MNPSPAALFSGRRLALLAPFVLALTGSLHAETDGTITKSFSASPGGTLVADISMGGIDVEGTSGTTVEIVFTRKVNAASTEEEERILADHVVTIEQDGDTISVQARGPKRGSGGSFWRQMFGGGDSRKFHLSVRVPTEFNLNLKTAGGGIDVEKLTGTVKVETSGGGLDFSDIRGPINGRTSGGGIELERCSGEVDVNTSGGGIESEDGEGRLAVNTSGGGISIQRHRGDVRAHTSGGGIRCTDIAGNIDANTSGGSVSVELTTAPTADCRLETSGGGITLTLPANSAVTLDASTSAGSVDSDFDVTTTGERKRSRLSGTINGGGPQVRLRSSAGSIDINEGPAGNSS